MAIIAFIFTIDYSKNVTTILLLTIEHMAMLVVKSIVIQIKGQVMDLSMDSSTKFQAPPHVTFFL